MLKSDEQVGQNTYQEQAALAGAYRYYQSRAIYLFPCPSFLPPSIPLDISFRVVYFIQG